MYFYQLDCYERAIREPGQHDKTIINCYVHLCIELAKHSSNTTQANRVYLRMLKNFEEVICDDLLSSEWRTAGFKVFKQIKPILYEIMCDTSYRNMSAKFDRLAEYFIGIEERSAQTSQQMNPKQH